jgi:hypothetical protein
MKDIQKTILIFLFGCIGIRTIFLIMSKNINKDYLPYMGYIAILISISLIYQFIKKERKMGAFNNEVWWDKLRPIHAINYAIFAYMAINKSSNAWIPLLIDVIIGLSAHLYYHCSKGHI